MKKILLVEDDTFIRDIYFRELTNAKYDVTQVEDGQIALEKAQSEKFDLILLDIMLPKMTGLEVLKELRTSTSEFKETPIYLLTNLGQASVVKEALELGIQGYLLKARLLPVDIINEVGKFFSQGPMELDIKKMGLE